MSKNKSQESLLDTYECSECNRHFTSWQEAKLLPDFDWSEDEAKCYCGGRVVRKEYKPTAFQKGYTYLLILSIFFTVIGLPALFIGLGYLLTGSENEIEQSMGLLMILSGILFISNIIKAILNPFLNK